MKPAAPGLILVGLLSLPVFVDAAELIAGSELRGELGETEIPPVIDARGVAERSMLAIPGALVYLADAIPDAPLVVVVADSDDEALSVATALETARPGLTALALSGGYDAFRVAYPSAALPARSEGWTPAFTIPSDTCQTGPALQTFEAQQ